MTKIIISICLCLISCVAPAQDSLTTPLTYSEVIKVDSSISAQQLYLRSRTWFAEAYRSARDVIQMDDKENGKIVGKGNIQYSSRVFIGSSCTKGWVRYTVTIQVRQGRYKYELTNFNHEGSRTSDCDDLSFGLITKAIGCPYKIGKGTGQGWRNKVWRDIKDKIEANIILMLESLKNSMNKLANDKESNW